MFDPRTTPLDPRSEIDRPDLVAGMLAVLISLASTAMFVMLYVPVH